MTPDKAPEHLSEESQKLWMQLNDEWEIDLSGLILLRVCLESYDRF